jgi:hypothetical protein
VNLIKRAIVTIAVVGTMLGAAAPAFAATDNAPQDTSKPGSMCVRLTLWDWKPTLCAPLV